MILSTVDLVIKIDFGNDKPGAILQRKDKGHWHDYLIDGKPVVNPFDVETLPPGLRLFAWVHRFCALLDKHYEAHERGVAIAVGWRHTGNPG